MSGSQRIWQVWVSKGLWRTGLGLKGLAGLGLKGLAGLDLKRLGRSGSQGIRQARSRKIRDVWVSKD